MEVFSFKNLSFSYPNAKANALNNLSFKVNSGDFILLCGPSGCGKSTLLRHFKKCLTPYGATSGEIIYNGNNLLNVAEETQAGEIGFVMQSPEDQVVTDKVWHELAFGLERMGVENEIIRRRVAEVAAFFNIESWFYKDVNSLSGGQKQILSLASVMVMNPKVLVLDEPTSQLSPIASDEFLALLGKINRELGVTVILSEHRLEEAFNYANRIMVMQKGEIIFDDAPKKVGLALKNSGSGMFLAMPTPMRVWAAMHTEAECPLSLREGVEFLTALSHEKEIVPLPKIEDNKNEDIVLDCSEVYFKYQKDAPDVLKGMSLKLKKGEIYAVLGGNGAGKTTALRLFAGFNKAYSGKIKVSGRVGLLPQNPQALFVKSSVRDDLFDALSQTKISKAEKENRVKQTAELCKLEEILDCHPYDISGGEQQRTALAKLLLTNPDILLLDEPTKGFDAEFKLQFGEILKELSCSGISVIMVSHDLNFCAEYAQKCGMLFDGNIVTEGSNREFFSGNSFYTTTANRMARHIIPKAVTVDDILKSFGITAKPKNNTPNNLQIQNKPQQTYLPPVKTEKAKLSKRRILATVINVLFIPLTIFLGVYFLENKHYNIIALVVLLLSITPFLLVFEGRRPKARELCIIAVLCAIAVASRCIFFMLPQVKPVLALTILAGVAFSGETGFLVGSITMLVSNMMFSQGPFTPWQMFAMGIIGFFAGLIFKKVNIKKITIPLAIFGAISTVVIYGIIMNTYAALTMSTELFNFKSLWVYWLAGLPMDIVHAVSTAIFLLLGAKPILKILQRIKLKYGLL